MFVDSKKFDQDIKDYSYIMRLLISFDQFVGCIFWVKSQDETISSLIGRKNKAGIANWFEKSICYGLRLIESKHCSKSIGE